MNTVTDYIGIQYKEWKNRDRIFISSPTGSGKTYFILKVLLKHFSDHNMKILYLVNRRILKEQLEMELSNLEYKYKKNIQVELYQSIENKITSIRGYGASGYNGVKDLEKFNCVVCDECHYFLTDSNYNTKTAISFRWIRDTFANKLQIYMSATIDEFKRFVQADEEKRKCYGTPYYGFHVKNHYSRYALTHPIKELSYGDDVKYDYINPHILWERSDILNITINDNKKWLIFVDNIKFGKELQKDLKTKLKEVYGAKTDKTVILITSDYDNKEESLEEVEQITSKNKQSAKILIATSVMDNGINIKDVDLRKIVLIADTKTEFIQMLGRKRKDGKNVDLYIYNHDKSYFVNRLWQVKKIKKIAEDYLECFERKIQEPLNEHVSGLQINWNMYNEIENKLIMQQHMKIEQDIEDNKVSFEDTSKIYFKYSGVTFMNLLAFQNIENLVIYYQEMISRFDQVGEDAFAIEQLKWLGRSEEESLEIIEDSRTERIGVTRKKVIKAFKDILDKPLDFKDALTFKKKIKSDVIYLIEQICVESQEKEKYINSFNKVDRPISKGALEYLSQNCNIPFVMEVEESVYTVRNYLNQK